MRVYRWMIGLSTGLCLVTNPLLAKTTPTTEQIQIPNCLADKLATAYDVLAENAAFKIIDVPTTDMKKLALFADQVHCGRFMNVSHQVNQLGLASKKDAAHALLDKKKAKPVSDQYEIRHEEEVNAALAHVDTQHIMDTLTHLTTYYNRSATTSRGAEVAKWLNDQFNAMVKESGRKDVSTFFVKTGWYQQPSLVTVIGKDLKAPGVVLGAHMDTLDGRMPGAGDDGSGSSSLMEAARVLLTSNITFKRPIYIIWYAAEERGLVGSQYVVSYFQNKSIPVKAVLQFDMTGYRNNGNDETMWIYRDYTNKTLNGFVAELIDTYVKVPINYSQCGYGCSDHASWTEVGIPASFPCETSFDVSNPYIHTSRDTMDRLYSDHMTNFTKLGVGFAIELASE